MVNKKPIILLVIIAIGTAFIASYIYNKDIRNNVIVLTGKEGEIFIDRVSKELTREEYNYLREYLIAHNDTELLTKQDITVKDAISAQRSNEVKKASQKKSNKMHRNMTSGERWERAVRTGIPSFRKECDPDLEKLGLCTVK